MSKSESKQYEKVKFYPSISVNRTLAGFWLTAEDIVTHVRLYTCGAPTLKSIPSCSPKSKTLHPWIYQSLPAISQ